MIITYHGHQYFKLQAGNTIWALNPISKEANGVTKPTRFGADVVLSSVRHPLYHGIDTVTYNEKEPFVIDSPGQYEIYGNLVEGVGKKITVENEEYYNTMYSFTFDDLSVVFLGVLNDSAIPDEFQETLEEVDVLFAPINPINKIDVLDAYKTALSFNPRIILPMDYEGTQGKESLTTFLKEGGVENADPVDKLTLKTKDVANREGDIFVFNS